MGRDWTPRELLRAEQVLSDRPNVPRMREHNYIIKNMATGELREMFNKEEWAIKRQYDNLGFLFDNFVKLYKNYHSESNIRIYVELERVLTGIIDDIDIESSVFDINIVKKWFYGKLDRDFYYNTENNRLFEEYIIEILNKESI